jgi:hypothetical protein
MPEILYLSLYREFFDAVAEKRKRIEYRDWSAQWRISWSRIITARWRKVRSDR